MKKYKSLKAGVAELSQCSTRAGATGTASLFGALPPMRPAIGVCGGGPDSRTPCVVRDDLNGIRLPLPTGFA